MSVATGEPVAELERRFDGSGYGDFKEAVGEAVVDAARADPGALPTSCAPTSGSCNACSRSARRRRGGASEPTLEAMYERMGFVKAEAGRLFGAARPRGL